MTYKFLFNTANDTDFWIGAEDMFHNDTYFWPTGNAMKYYTHWGGPGITYVPEQPELQSGPNADYCMYLNFVYNHSWFDDSCVAYKTGYICEITSSTGNLGGACQVCLFQLLLLSDNILCTTLHFNSVLGYIFYSSPNV